MRLNIELNIFWKRNVDKDDYEMLKNENEEVLFYSEQDVIDYIKSTLESNAHYDDLPLVVNKIKAMKL